MKTVLLLLLAMLAIKTTTATTALGQNACSNLYTGCVDRCVGRPTKTLQDSCMETCQTQNNACFSQVFGGPGPSAQTVREETAKPDNAVAAAKPERPAAKPAARPQAQQPERRPQ